MLVALGAAVAGLCVTNVTDKHEWGTFLAPFVMIQSLPALSAVLRFLRK
jgi:hypothetical protein